MMAASSTLEATKPSASVSFCRLTTRNNTTAVPMQASALTMSSRPPTRTRVSAPEPTM
jgi:hypothetical protein